ncbi:MAG TPA: hypothetical protein VFL60_05385 [Gaiellaceae bacterium]|nr:hypothetical protein [Gaiellaceae bacterium]
MADWVTISALATAGGTLALAVTTYASVRSANRAARVAEMSLLAGLRPLLVESNESAEILRVNFFDVHGVAVPGGRAAVELIDGNVYIVVSLRNVGSGIAVMHGGRICPERQRADVEAPPLDSFRRLSRDIYVPPGAVGYWQIAFRDDTEAKRASLAAIGAGTLTADVLYGDFEGGQRAISRYLLAREEDGAWHTTTIRHWQVDRADPR